MQSNPTNNKLFTTRKIKRHPSILTFLLVLIIDTLQFQSHYGFSTTSSGPITTFLRHIQQYQQHCTVVRRRKSRIFNTMEDSNVITNRKRAANHETDDNDNVHDESLKLGVNHKRMKLMPTIRTFSSFLSPLDTTISYPQRKETALRDIQTYTQSMLERHQQMIPFTNEIEISMIRHSLQNVIPKSTINNNSNNNQAMMHRMLQELQDRILPQYAHLSHKNWTTTGENAEQWHSFLFPSSLSSSSNSSSNDNNGESYTLLQRHMFERIYREGNWDGAVWHRSQQDLPPPPNTIDATTKQVKPWAVLVTVRS